MDRGELELTSMATAYTGPLKQLRSQETGMAISGEWIGIYYRRGTDGKIPSSGGNRLQIICRVHISTSKRKKLPSILL